MGEIHFTIGENIFGNFENYVCNLHPIIGHITALSCEVWEVEWPLKWQKKKQLFCAFDKEVKQKQNKTDCQVKSGLSPPQFQSENKWRQISDRTVRKYIGSVSRCSFSLSSFFLHFFGTFFWELSGNTSAQSLHHHSKN